MLVSGRQNDGAAVVPPDLVDETLRASLARLPSLDADQFEMAARLASSAAGVECVEAAPRTGKTTALGVYVAAEPELERLVAAASRSHAQVMALDRFDARRR